MYTGAIAQVSSNNNCKSLGLSIRIRLQAANFNLRLWIQPGGAGARGHSVTATIRKKHADKAVDAVATKEGKPQPGEVSTAVIRPARQYGGIRRASSTFLSTHHPPHRIERKMM